MSITEKIDSFLNKDKQWVLEGQAERWYAAEKYWNALKMSERKKLLKDMADNDSLVAGLVSRADPRFGFEDLFQTLRGAMINYLFKKKLIKESSSLNEDEGKEVGEYKGFTIVKYSDTKFQAIDYGYVQKPLKLAPKSSKEEVKAQIDKYLK